CGRRSARNGVAVPQHDEPAEAVDGAQGDEDVGAEGEEGCSEGRARAGAAEAPGRLRDGPSRSRDNHAERVLLGDACRHRGTSSTTVVPAPGAENSRALPPTSRSRATTDSANPRRASSMSASSKPTPASVTIARTVLSSSVIVT